VARRALATADRALVARHRAPSPGADSAHLVLLGEAPIEVGETWGLPLSAASRARRIVMPVASDQLAVHALDEGLSCLSCPVLPAGLIVLDEPRDMADDGFTRVGLHALALHPARDEIAVGGVSPDHEPLVVVLDGDGDELGQPALEEDEWVRAAAYSGSGETLWVVVDCDSTVRAVAFTTAGGVPERVGSVDLGADFPPPAFIQAHGHPSEEAVLVEIACGQDGFWLKCAAREDGSIVERPHALSESTEGFPLLGFGAGGSLVATAGAGSDDPAEVRSWPTMEVVRQLAPDGSLVAGAAAGDVVMLAVAEVTDDPSRFELRSFATGDLLCAGSWPAGETLQAMVGDVALTTVGDRVRAYRVKSAAS
jgi:hypothetical protein